MLEAEGVCSMPVMVFSAPISIGINEELQRYDMIMAVSGSIMVTPSECLRLMGSGFNFGILKEWLTYDSANLRSILSL